VLQRAQEEKSTIEITKTEVTITPGNADHKQPEVPKDAQSVEAFTILDEVRAALRWLRIGQD
jgi:hypothetical protein